MILDTRLEALVEIRDYRTNSSGRPYFEASLVSDDAQTLHLYEGQLKELPNDKLELGKRYRVVFRPFVNHRWIEIKIESLQIATD